jgi:hypothetical protein
MVIQQHQVQLSYRVKQQQQQQQQQQPMTVCL